MFKFFVKCPTCGGMHRYCFGDTDSLTFRIGDIIDEETASYNEKHKLKCRTCSTPLLLIIVVEKGKLINALLDPTEEEIENSKEAALKTLTLSKIKFDYDTRHLRLLGEDTAILPSQFNANHRFKIGDFIPFFNIFWRIDESYKVVGRGDYLYERVYKIVSLRDNKERLLVTSINRLPALREVDWDSEYWLTDDEKLRKYKLRPGFSLVMETE